MRRYQTGVDRRQQSILPPRVEDYGSANNSVRAIDAYVDTLDLRALGFKNTEPVMGAVGQPPYDPAALLKLYLYGYGSRASAVVGNWNGRPYRNLEAMGSWWEGCSRAIGRLPTFGKRTVRH
ncbi:MAG: transposase [Methylococcales bacterium]